MSLQDMFAPGAAAVASGAAYSDGAGSVVFRAPTVDQTRDWPSVQRLGLPGSDVLSSPSLLAGRARDATSGYVDTARDAAGGYLETARNTAGGAAATAQNAVAGYGDAVQDAGGSMADSALDSAGDAASSARETVGGAMDSVQGAAGGMARTAQNATGGAIGAVAGASAAASALPTDLDELARRLFDPLSARLKSELWLDRERAGMVTDLRR